MLAIANPIRLWQVCAQITRMGQSKMVQTFEQCIDQGKPVLIENMDNKVDAVLVPVIGHVPTAHHARRLCGAADANATAERLPWQRRRNGSAQRGCNGRGGKRLHGTGCGHHTEHDRGAR